MREAELAEHERARGKRSTVGAFLGAFLLSTKEKPNEDDLIGALFEPQTTHHFSKSRLLIKRRSGVTLSNLLTRSL